MAQTHPDFPQDTRNRLLEAALLVFAEKGFDGAGIREIAEKAKANSAMVQYHFGGKDGLFKEALRYAFEQGPKRTLQLLPPPAPDEPNARARALDSFKIYMRTFLHEMMECQGKGDYLPAEVERAAHMLWNRELQYPRPDLEGFILEAIQPYVQYLNQCLGVLRPDLDQESLFRMSLSIEAQILWMHTHMELTRLLRGEAYGPSDMDSLADHFIQFSLRGLNIPEAF